MAKEELREHYEGGDERYTELQEIGSSFSCLKDYID